MMEYLNNALVCIGILVGMTIFTLFLLRLPPKHWSREDRSLTFWGCYVTAWTIISLFSSYPGVAETILFGAIWIVPESAVWLAKRWWGIVIEEAKP